MMLKKQFEMDGLVNQFSKLYLYCFFCFSNEYHHIIYNSFSISKVDAVTVEQLKDFIRKRNGQLPSRAVKKNLFDHAQKLIN